MRRWHRRLGAVLGLIAILFAVTGIALNHAQQLQLDRSMVRSPLILAWYGIELPLPVAYQVGDHWVSHWGGNHLYFQHIETSYCEPPLAGAVLWQQLIVVACGDGLVLMDTDGALIERVGDIYQLPRPITGLIADQALFLQTPGAVFRADLETFSWTPAQTDAEPVKPKRLPAALERDLRNQLAGAELSVARVLADIHSGRILGTAGVWLADIAALGIIFLGLSGLWMWWRQYRRRR